jgi:hypothetical protein
MTITHTSPQEQAHQIKEARQQGVQAEHEGRGQAAAAGEKLALALQVVCIPCVRAQALL